MLTNKQHQQKTTSLAEVTKKNTEFKSDMVKCNTKKRFFTMQYTRCWQAISAISTQKEFWC